MPEPSSTIDVLVVEDSAVTRLLLVNLIEQDRRLRVVGVVDDGRAAVEFLKMRKPDVVLMDIHMPRLDGFEATRLIMETQPVPIVVCSAISDVRDTAVAFRALEVGAVACIEKPFARAGSRYEAQVAHLLQTLRLMAEVTVVRRRRTGGAAPGSTPAQLPLRPVQVRAVAIGASTGGPPVLQALLAALPATFPVPVLVVQHIAEGFLRGMADWLAGSSRLPIHIAQDGMLPLPGHVYLAPDGFHMGLGPAGRLILSDAAPENHVRPAVAFLFRTVAQVYGAAAVGVLLTGMGRDGAEELKLLKDRGAVTIAQDQESSLVHGMPGAAIALGGAAQVLPADRIAAALVALVATE